MLFGSSSSFKTLSRWSLLEVLAYLRQVDLHWMPMTATEARRKCQCHGIHFTLFDSVQYRTCVYLGIAYEYRFVLVEPYHRYYSDVCGVSDCSRSCARDDGPLHAIELSLGDLLLFEALLLVSAPSSL